jgi:hypothetical protein
LSWQSENDKSVGRNDSLVHPSAQLFHFASRFAKGSPTASERKDTAHDIVRWIEVVA